MIDPFDDDWPDEKHLDPEDDPEVAKLMLTNIDRGIVGSEKPRVQRTREYWTPPSMFEGSDNMPNDPEQADLSDIDD